MRLTKPLFIFSLLMIFILSVNTASAFLDVKSFDPNVSEYGEIKIKDWLFLNKADYRLTDYESSIIDVWAEGEYKLYKKTHLFTGIFYKDVLGRTGQLKDVKFYIWVNESYKVENPVYEETCQKIYNSTNQSYINQCEQNLLRTDIETKYKQYWKEYNKGDELPESEGKWRIEAKRKPNQKIDFILEAHGKTFDEWAWWDNSWSRKKEIKVQENQGIDYSNYTINLSVSYESSMQSDFDDLRFVDSTETTELSYWIESYTASTSAVVKVKVPTMTANTNSTIYMYYGNGAVGNNSDFENAYLFADNFDDGDFSSNWDDVGSVSESGGNLVLTSSGGLSGLQSKLNYSIARSQKDWWELVIEASTSSSTPGEGFSFGVHENWASSDYDGTGSVGGDGVGITYMASNALWRVYRYNSGSATFEGLGAGANNPIGTSRTIQLIRRNTVSNNNATAISDGAYIGAMESSSITYTGPMSIFISGRYSSNTVTINSIILKRYSDIDPTIIVGSEQNANGLAVTLNSPENYYNSSSSSVSFNCSAEDETEVINLTLVIDGEDNYTQSGGGSNFTELTQTLSFSDGDHNWSCRASDGSGQVDDPTTSNTRYFTIDTTPPEINITYPLNGSQIITFINPINISFNASISDDHLSSCWYYNGTANTTVTCGNNATLTLDYGDYNLYWYANDTHGNEASEPVSFSINYLQEDANYPNPAIEGETYPINITLNATELNSLNGTLYYNGTAYNTTSSIAGSTGTLNTTLFINPVSENAVKTFFWNYTLNGNNYTSSTYNHTIYFINPINVSVSCSAELSPSMCFDFKDELNLTSLDAKIDYNFQFGISNSSYKTVYGSLGNSSNFCLCVNSTIYNNYTLGEGEIQYSKSGYADRRFYTFSTQRLSNSTINNTLYLLPSGSATSFLFDFKDTNLAPYINRYTTLLRWYPNLNEYKIVEMAKTDDKGETIMRVQTEDTDYRVGLYERNGSLITLLNPVRFACISAPCSYSSLVDSEERDYTSFFNVEGLIEFNETTNIWTLTWNDPTQNTKSMNLLVTRERGDSSYTICDVSASGFTGVLTCDSTGYTGTLVATAYRTASPATPIFQKIINTLSSPFASSVGLFFSFILVALLMLIGVYSPVASVILGIIALLPALYMGVITLAVFIAIAVLGGIIIHFMKRTG